MIFFFFNDTATTEIYTLSLHDALPISQHSIPIARGTESKPLTQPQAHAAAGFCSPRRSCSLDRKSTRLNSSHANISYAVFCLKKKTQTKIVDNTYMIQLSRILSRTP